MTSSEDSADDFESADEDFDTNYKSTIPTLNSNKEDNYSFKDTPDVLKNSKATVTVHQSVDNLQDSSKDDSSSNHNIKLPDVKSVTSKFINTPSIPDNTSTIDNSVNDNSFNRNDEENNSIQDHKEKIVSSILLDSNDGEKPYKEANLSTKYNTISVESSEKRCLAQQNPSINDSIPQTVQSKVNDQNKPLFVKEVSSDETLIVDSADKAECGDGWDIEDDLETALVIDDTETEQAQVNKPFVKDESSDTTLIVDKADKAESGDGWDLEDGLETDLVIDDTETEQEQGDIKQIIVNTNTKSSDGWDDFDMEDGELIADKPGDGWEIEGGEDISGIAKTLDENLQPSQKHSCASKQVEESLQVDEKGWGGWGGWGVSSLLSTATGSVTTFSSQVSAGLSSVLETTVGAPDPETLATRSTSMQDSHPNSSQEENQPANYVGLGSIVSGVSFLGSTVINRGLDTLETLGKKTMEVLQEGDPGLMKKRAMLFPDQDKPVLSQILKEAKEKADQSDKEKEEKEVARKVHFESLFDDYNGMVHLEALEMLSTQCDLKLQALALSHTGAQLEELQETLSQVRDLCELPEDDDECEVLSAQQFADQVTKCISGLRISMTPAKLIQVNNAVEVRSSEQSSGSAVSVHQAAISSLAEFTAAGMECFHKSAELLLAKPTHNTPDEADNYVQLTSHLCARVSAIANDFTQLLTNNHPIANSSMITNIFLEASNSSSYIRNACQLLIPILQLGAVYT